MAAHMRAQALELLLGGGGGGGDRSADLLQLGRVGLLIGQPVNLALQRLLHR